MPTGHVWLEGDNLQNSTDSRYYGPVPYGLIRGRIFFKVCLYELLLGAGREEDVSLIKSNQFEIHGVQVDLTIAVTTFDEHFAFT